MGVRRSALLSSLAVADEAPPSGRSPGNELSHVGGACHLCSHFIDQNKLHATRNLKTQRNDFWKEENLEEWETGLMTPTQQGKVSWGKGINNSCLGRALIPTPQPTPNGTNEAE